MHVRWKQSGSGKTITTTTNYMGGMVFESRTTTPLDASQPDYTHRLQFIAHEEGRVRFTPLSGAVPARFSYDYFLKDHLGNTRMVLTEEASSETYPALSFEGAAGSVEVQNQDRYWENKAGQSINVAGVRTMHSTGTNAMLTRKDLGAIGAAKLLKVMSGDKIQTSVQFHYTATNANNSSASGINSQVANITQLIANSLSPSEVIKSGVSSLGSSLSSQTAHANLLNTANTASGSNQAPKAYLHVLLFNDQFKFDAVNSKVIPVPYTVNSWGTLSRIGANAVSVKKNGYAYVYFSNESNELVYFDNFNLTQERGPVLEETHYYPFGLTMAGISSKAAGKLENKRKWNSGSELESKEFSDGSGVDLYATQYRSLDPQVGRFWELDPRPDYAQSLYSSMSNNPIRYNDPLGDSINNPRDQRIAARIEGNINRKISSNDQSITNSQNTITSNNEKLSKLRADVASGSLAGKNLKSANKEIGKLEKSNASANANITEMQGQNALLNQSLGDIGNMRTDVNFNYTFGSPDAGSSAHFITRGTGNNVIIQGSNDGLYVHEIRHVGQSLANGGLRFSSSGKLIAVGSPDRNVTRQQEVNAYQVQFSFDRNSYPAPGGARILADINITSLLTIPENEY